MQLSELERGRLAAILETYDRHPEVQRMREFIQHGDVTVYAHVTSVARASLSFAERLGRAGISVDRASLLRGALLHDYFLYDWHDTTPKNGLHGFSHPYTAFCNALGDFDLTEIEVDVIVKHMFPLTPIFPRFKESAVVSIMDKICSLYEVFGRNTYKNPAIRLAHAKILEHARVKVPVIAEGAE